MVDITALPDQAQVERIRERLWIGREFGRAAVMVGSGFSRNAERRSASDPPFPLWGDIANAMHEALYPSTSVEEPAEEDERPRATAGAGAVRLASEYEAVFGRPDLNELLVRLIPDALYEPGYLHELLLSLPWSDVFTTNYDTLIERARPVIADRKYDLVFTASDMPAQTKPRIVKLHGSFPSHRPFIITEEDYRTYLTKFAPFVNMVQQSIMENAFCLVGFSGDDPNFLRWSGWVRDNLGPAAPPIYLCGVLDLSNSQRRLLEDRNVIPVDLAPLFPTEIWPDPDERRARALEWFLLNLKEGESPTVMDWPIPRRVPPIERSEGLPPVPPGPRPISDPGPEAPENRVLSPDDINLNEVKELHKVWRRKRLKEYPGWVVAPEKNRRSLWRFTKEWINPVLWSLDRLPPPDNLCLLYELNWRLETSLVPLFTDWHEKIEQVLNSYNPYPHLVEIESATVKPTEAEHRSLDWNFIAECWVALAFALAREAREDQEEGRFRFWMDRIKDAAQRREEWRARWFYEECLFHLFRLDEERVRSTLEMWLESGRLPFWEVKRASIVAELGDIQEADRKIDEALSEIRSRLRPYSLDFALLSQEGWTILLSEVVKRNLLLEALEQDLVETYENYVTKQRGRREELEKYGSDPGAEIRKLESKLVGQPPHLRRTDGIAQGFDPGSQSVTVSLLPDSSIDPVFPAFAFLKMLEDGGMLARCGSVYVFPETTETSSEWVEPHAPLWAITSVIRVLSEQDIYKWFDRIYVASMPADRFSYLFGTFLSSLFQSIRRLLNYSEDVSMRRMSFSQRQVKIMAELLSHLSIRSSEEQLASLFDMAIQMYELPLFQRHHWLYGCLRSLFYRLLSNSMPQAAILQRMPELLALPIPGNDSFRVSPVELWVEPFNHVVWDLDSRLAEDFDRSAWSTPIANLLRTVRDGEPEARKRATMRLTRLHEIEGLTSTESQHFGEALWSRIDPDTHLPSDTALLGTGSYYPSAFLVLPEPEAGRAKERFKQLMLLSNFRQVVTRFNYPDGREGIAISRPLSDDPYPQQLLDGTVPLFPDSEERERLIDWSRDEAVAFLEKMINYWDDEKEALRPTLESSIDSGFKRALMQRYWDWLRVLAEIVLPKVADANDETQDTARRLLTELEQAGVSVLIALPMSLYLDPEIRDEVARKMRAGLVSIDEGPVGGAAEGLYYWLARGVGGGVAPPPDTLLDELVNRALGRRQPGLRLVLARLRDIARTMPESLSSEQIDTLCLALEYLLNETRLPQHEDRNDPGQLTAPIPVDQRPEHRRIAAQLASWLFSELERRNADVPQILTEWRRISREDPLPEVRQAWSS